MQAILFREGQLVFERNYPEPIPRSGEVLVDIVMAGICETDLQLCKGYMGFSGVLGHEFVGIPRTGMHAGQRVVGEINCICNQCENCRVGAGNHCPDRTVVGILGRDGAFAESIAIPEQNLHAVPASVSSESAVFTEPLAAALQIGEQVELVNKRVAILGDGRLGMMCVQAVSMVTSDITVIGKHKQKLARFEPFASQIALLDSISIKPSYDVVIDCTGSPTGLELAGQLVRPRGVIVMKTTVAGKHDLSLASLVINEVTLVGSRCGPFEKAVAALEQEKVDVNALISHRFHLSDAKQALKTAMQPDALKVIFAIS